MDLANWPAFGVFADAPDTGDGECHAKLNNDVPCFCITETNIVFGSIEFVCFSICIASFFLVRLKLKQSIHSK